METRNKEFWFEMRLIYISFKSMCVKLKLNPMSMFEACSISFKRKNGRTCESTIEHINAKKAKKKKNEKEKRDHINA